MDDDALAQLHHVAHETEVQAVLLMDLLRIAHWTDPAAYQAQVEEAERELRESLADPHSAMHGRGSRRVLEHRLAYLRSVQIGQAAVG